MENNQPNKAQILEKAVINNSPEEIADIMKELGSVDFSARALGTACRFCGIETVKVLAENGASFDIPKTEETEKQYCCYAGRELKKMRSDNYRSNFSLCLLNILTHTKGACCFKGVKLLKQVKREDKAALKLLPDEERSKVLKYLCENKEKLSFDPSEMLYHAIFAEDDFIVTELKKSGVTVSETRRKIITEGGSAANSYWYEYGSMTGKLSGDNYLGVMKKLAAELKGKKFYCTEKIYEITKGRFANKEIFEFFRDNFNYDRLSKTRIIRDLIDGNAAASLRLIEEMGWLSNIKRRDEVIRYSQDNNRPECTAFLLDYKNRTADFAAEREKEEKKRLSELNASPNSVMMLKKIWSYKKGEDGNLIITGYKGSSTVITVPQKIGEDRVTEIDDWAFSPYAYRIKEPTRQFRRTIRKIVLPEGLNKIGTSAFCELSALESVNIPKSVRSIGEYAFRDCYSLKSIIVPEGVTDIGNNAFSMLDGKGELEYAELPSTLNIFKKDCKWWRPYLFNSKNCPKLIVTVPHAPHVEEFCEHNKIKFIYTEDKKQC